MIPTIARPALALCLMLAVCSAKAQNAAPSGHPLQGVKTIQVEPTVVPKPEAVKETSAPNMVQDSLKNAIRAANIELADSAPVRAHIVLDEFTSGSTAKRVLIGMGAGS